MDERRAVKSLRSNRSASISSRLKDATTSSREVCPGPKALGCGFGRGVGLRDVSVSHDRLGRPVARLSGRVQEIADEQGVFEMVICMSCTTEMAVANAVAVTDAVRRKIDKTVDNSEMFISSFKEARSVIDELERLQMSMRGHRYSYF